MILSGFTKHAANIAAALCLVMAAGGCTRVNPPPRPNLSKFPPGLESAIAGAESAIAREGDACPAWLKLGQLYHANGFYAEARSCYQRMIKSADQGARACYGLADVAELSSDLGEERHWLEETLLRDPGYVPARLRFAGARYKSGDTAGAITLFNEVIRQDAGNAPALIGLAREYLRTGEESAAVPILEKMTREHPEFATGHMMLAQVLEHRGDKTGAALLRGKALKRKDPPMTDPWGDEVMRQCYDVQSLTIRFEDYQNAGLATEARAYLQRIEAIDPTNWQVYRVRGLDYERKGLLEEAAREYERGLAAGGEAGKLYPTLVTVLVKSKRYPEAEEKARAGLKAAPRTPGLLVELAQLLYRNGTATEAVQLLDQAIAIEPRNLAANRTRAQIHWTRNEREKALPMLRIVQQADPGDAATRALIGQYFVEKGAPAEAVAPLEQAMAIAPKDEDIAELLAMAYLRVGNQRARDGQFTDAQAGYDKAIALRPELIEAYIDKARVLIHLSEITAAEQALQPLLKTQSRNPTVLLTLGDIQHALGRDDQARASWTQAAKFLRFEDNPPLKEALARRLGEIDAR